MKKYALILMLPLLAACEDMGMADDDMVMEEDIVMETDMSEANMATDCPVDVSEADRANYPACN